MKRSETSESLILMLFRARNVEFLSYLEIARFQRTGLAVPMIFSSDYFIERDHRTSFPSDFDHVGCRLPPPFDEKYSEIGIS